MDLFIIKLRADSFKEKLWRNWIIMNNNMKSSKSRSREATPEAAAAEGAAATVARLQKLTDELRASRIAERQRRHQANNARRAISTEPRDTLAVPQTRTPTRAPSLKKRSVSLEQTTKEQNVIWKSVDDSSVSSLQSLEQEPDLRVFGVARDNSLDSRLSGGSAQSDVLPEKKKKKSIFGKLKKLTKSRSIDDQAGPDEFRPIGTVSQGSDSDMSAAGSRRDLRGRISDMFHRKGTLSRGNSKEQTPERAASALGMVSASSTLPRNASSATLGRVEPAPSSRPASRAASATPAVKRKGK